MLRMCLAPLVLVGFLQTIQTSWHSSKDISGGMAEVQTCKDGLGVRLAFSDQMVQIGPQYGYSWALTGKWSIIAKANGGWGYSNTIHPTTGVRQVTKFNGGLSLSVMYAPYVVQVSYQHMSNGRGIDPTNHGVDLITTGVGYAF
jgi:hypothetical protein